MQQRFRTKVHDLCKNLVFRLELSSHYQYLCASMAETQVFDVDEIASDDEKLKAKACEVVQNSQLDTDQGLTVN